jgi:hypothetical protein
MYWDLRLAQFLKFVNDTVRNAEDPPDSLCSLHSLVNNPDKFRALQMHFAFVFQYMDPVYKLIESFQKQTGGPADPLGCLEGIKQQMSPPSNGVWGDRVHALFKKLSTTQAVKVGSQLKEAA